MAGLSLVPTNATWCVMSASKRLSTTDFQEQMKEIAFNSLLVMASTAYLDEANEILRVALKGASEIRNRHIEGKVYEFGREMR